MEDDSTIPPRVTDGTEVAAEHAAVEGLPQSANSLRNRSAKVHPTPTGQEASNMYGEPKKPQSGCTQFIWLWFILVAAFALAFGFILGMLLEGKAIHAFDDDNDESPSKSEAVDQYAPPWEPEYPRCPYGSDLVKSNGIQKRARPDALRISRPNEDACGNLCKEIKSCIKATFRQFDKTCYIETSEKLQCDEDTTTDEPNCSSSSDCFSYVKVCGCPPGHRELKRNKTKLWTKRALYKMTRSMRCSNGTSTPEEYLYREGCEKV